MYLIEELKEKEDIIQVFESNIGQKEEVIDDIGQEASKLSQILLMYQNQNPEGLNSLKWEGLEKLETSLLRLLDSVKLTKSLKILEHRIN